MCIFDNSKLGIDTAVEGGKQHEKETEKSVQEKLREQNCTLKVFLIIFPFSLSNFQGESQTLVRMRETSVLPDEFYPSMKSEFPFASKRRLISLWVCGLRGRQIS